MKSYLWGVFWCFLVSFFLGTGWYVFFGYDRHSDLFGNLVSSYSSYSFWLGVAIWTILYSVFIAFPVIFVRQKPVK